MIPKLINDNKSREADGCLHLIGELHRFLSGEKELRRHVVKINTIASTKSDKLVFQKKVLTLLWSLAQRVSPQSSADYVRQAYY